MMRSFPIAEAQLAALFMQSIAYGMHAVTFAACIYTWFHQSYSSGGRMSGRWLWMFVAVAFFVIGTCDVSFNFYHNVIAFIVYKGPGGANAQFDQFSNWVNFMRIYRCWLVYTESPHRTIVGIVPAILWLAWLSIAIVLLYYAVTLNTATSIPGTLEIQPFVYAFYSTTLTINVFTTGLVIVRLWKFHRRNAELFSRSWRVPGRMDWARYTLIIVESALLYTATVVTCIALDLVGTNAYYGMTDIVSEDSEWNRHLYNFPLTHPILQSLEAAGITFDLIIIRIWTGVSTEQTQAFMDTVQHASKVVATAHDEQIKSAPSAFTARDVNTLDLTQALPGDHDDQLEWQRNGSGNHV
ncbi:uncharacterized protein B0H18DRAFT_218554 [Fomitopsis serialis]|uniref:uncharacterized protein n=1 Tax=Fomitopsis serialis TaxID=139415 RepID=UPI002007575A|nr:uncharacterized protein B0H18DRAFT_218554 [Neoantrodia serialis]KAH9913020.1 hypothetical protein B0H18DRAFT_218554 [Neoantrodia serialis]